MDQDPLFILAPQDSLYEPKHAIPMATYAGITAFDEPQLLFTLFEQGDLDFKLISKATQIIEELDQDRLVDQLLLLNQQERLLVADFKQHIKNSSYIQSDHYLQHNLSERVTLWGKFGSLLKAYKDELTLDIARLTALIMGLWKNGILSIAVRVKAIRVYKILSWAITRLPFVLIPSIKNHETYEFYTKAIKFAIYLLILHEH